MDCTTRILLPCPKCIYAFDQPFGRAIGTFAPQTVFVVEESTTSFGWLKLEHT